jgi:hypothetical protein
MSSNSINCNDNISNISSIAENPQYSTYRKNLVFYDVIKGFSVKDKRKILSLMRLPEVGVDTLFPSYGITAGEFSTWAILAGTGRKKKQQNQQ